MASTSTLDPDNFPGGAKRRGDLKGHDIGALGPGDSSDTGSDLAGSLQNPEGIEFDRGTGDDMSGLHANDIDTDRVVGAEEAGLGGGLDQAEEAQLGEHDGDAAHARGSSMRRQRIAEAAYYRAQERSFAPGQEDDDWLAAEREMDADPK